MMQASLRSLSAFRTGMKSSVSWLTNAEKCWLRKIQRALPVLHHSFPQIWFAQTDGELPCRAGEFAKGSQTYAGTGTLRYTWWGVPILHRQNPRLARWATGKSVRFWPGGVARFAKNGPKSRCAQNRFSQGLSS